MEDSATPHPFTTATETARKLKSAYAEAGFPGLDIHPTRVAPGVWGVAVGALPTAVAARLAECTRERT